MRCRRQRWLTTQVDTIGLFATISDTILVNRLLLGLFFFFFQGFKLLNDATHVNAIWLVAAITDASLVDSAIEFRNGSRIRFQSWGGADGGDQEGHGEYHKFHGCDERGNDGGFI